MTKDTKEDLVKSKITYVRLSPTQYAKIKLYALQSGFGDGEAIRALCFHGLPNEIAMMSGKNVTKAIEKLNDKVPEW